MAEVIKLSKPPAEAPRDRFVVTVATQEILCSLHLVMRTGPGAMTLITGAPGVGKSFTLEHFKQEIGPNAHLHTAKVGQSTPEGLARQLVDDLDLGPWQSLSWAGRVLGEKLWSLTDRYPQNDPMLIFDEAQNLVRQNNGKGRDNWETLEWLRGHAEEHDFNVAFCGGDLLRDAQKKVPQLWTRCLRRVHLSNLPKADIAAFARSYAIADEGLVALIYDTAKRERWLGTAQRILETATNGVDGETLSAAHIMAAQECWGFGNRGAKR